MTGNQPLDGEAIVYCDGSYNTPCGKTAHGLVRHTRRYRVLSVIDRRHAGCDAGDVIDQKPRGIPVVASLADALGKAAENGDNPSYFVIGVAPDGGRLPPEARETVKEALRAGLHVDCGLHDFLSEDPAIAALARELGLRIRDVRKTPGRNELHHFSSRIEEVKALKIAILGTDSAVGKRTTAWLIVDALRARGISAEMIGTGQTAWMQGARYSIILDSLINDFVAGELENAVVTCWDELKPQVIVVEGQGSLMNPAYPGGFEIMAATRPDVLIMQHAPTRVEYDGFPGYPLHPIEVQIQATTFLSGKPVVAITLNHEGLGRDQIPEACRRLTEQTGLPCCDALVDGVDPIVDVLVRYL